MFWKAFPHNIAPLIAPFTVFGAIKRPWNMVLVCPKVKPHSPPIPGEVIRQDIFSIRSPLPAIYPPVNARPPPGFLINEPATTSAPTSVCLLYTSDAADEEDSVDLGGRR